MLFIDIIVICCCYIDIMAICCCYIDIIVICCCYIDIIAICCCYIDIIVTVNTYGSGNSRSILSYMCHFYGNRRSVLIVVMETPNLTNQGRLLFETILRALFLANSKNIYRLTLSEQPIINGEKIVKIPFVFLQNSDRFWPDIS